jgi:hypothetical protein
VSVTGASSILSACTLAKASVEPYRGDPRPLDLAGRVARGVAVPDERLIERGQRREAGNCRRHPLRSKLLLSTSKNPGAGAGIRGMSVYGACIWGMAREYGSEAKF